ncbi:MAG: YbhN family protein [Phycisphaeraceae bacterium]
MIRLLLAVLGVAYILYTLSWSDRVWLPERYSLTPQVQGGESGEYFYVLGTTKGQYKISPERSSDSRLYEFAWLDKSEISTGENQPQFKPSFITILKQADGKLLLFGGLLFIPIVLLSTLRWYILMRARGIGVGLGRVARLTLAGYFFNLCMPGTTGGDVMKAFYAAKGTDQRADAVVSIAIDRLCGLVGLILIVGLIGLFSLDDPLIRKLTLAMWCLLVGLIVGAWLYTSPAIRSRLRLEAKLGNLPGAAIIRNLDAWVTAYRHHLGALASAIGLSLVIHLCLASAMSLAGFALGVDQPLLYLMGTIPIVLLLWSLPVSGPLGLGPLDYVAVQLIVGTSVTSDQQALMMFVAFRLYLVALGLLGSFALLGLGQRVSEPKKQDRES